MLKMLKHILQQGEGTVKYPFAPLKQAKDVRGKPEHTHERCIACAACASVCPPNAIQMDADTEKGTIVWSINYGRCIFCGRCEERCPTSAIKLTPEFELAVMAKDDLTDTCTFQLQKCSECGRYFAPRKEVEYTAMLLERIGNDGAAYENVSVCLDCKRKHTLDMQGVKLERK